MSSLNRRIRLIAAWAGLLLSVAALFWLKAKHNPSEAVDVASVFTAHVQAKQFAQAYELTAKIGHVGTSLPEFESIALRQACDAQRIVGTFPFQSNGNRLRRLVRGEAVEMPEVTVEFEGSPCLLGVTVRRTPSNTWQVTKFDTHAG